MTPEQIKEIEDAVLLEQSKARWAKGSASQHPHLVLIAQHVKPLIDEVKRLREECQALYAEQPKAQADAWDEATEQAARLLWEREYAYRRNQDVAAELGASIAEIRRQPNPYREEA